MSTRGRLDSGPSAGQTVKGYEALSALVTLPEFFALKPHFGRQFLNSRFDMVIYIYHHYSAFRLPFLFPSKGPGPEDCGEN